MREIMNISRGLKPAPVMGAVVCPTNLFLRSLCQEKRLTDILEKLLPDME